MASSDVLVLGNGDELFVDLVNKTPSGKKLVDLVGFMPHTTTAQAGHLLVAGRPGPREPVEPLYRPRTEGRLRKRAP